MKTKKEFNTVRPYNEQPISCRGGTSSGIEPLYGAFSRSIKINPEEPITWEMVARIDKVVMVDRLLSGQGIVWEIIDGIVVSHHVDNPGRKLKQPVTWWHIATQEEIVDSILKVLK